MEREEVASEDSADGSRSTPAGTPSQPGVAALGRRKAARRPTPGESYLWHNTRSGVRLELTGRRRQTEFAAPVYDAHGEQIGYEDVTVHSGGGWSPGSRSMTARSRWEMLRAIEALPWELLDRAVLITLTYPAGRWQSFVADDKEFGKHRDKLFKRWERRWGEPVKGFWVKEFQGRGAPHLHLVCSLPAAVTAEDYEGLRRQTKANYRNHQQFGKRKAGDLRRAVEGEFAWWLRTAWAEIVTGNKRGDRAARDHHAGGVDLRVRFDQGEGELENRVRMALYLWKDFGKESQKQAPETFGGVRQWWGCRGPGFRPQQDVWELGPAVWWRVRGRLIRWVALQIGKQKGWEAARDYRVKMERYKQGCDARGLDYESRLRFLRWSLAAERRKAEAGGTGAASEASSAAGFPGVVDRRTGELVTSSWELPGLVH